MASATFSSDDFTPVEQSPLFWRWSSPTHNVLPAAALATIRPLHARRAAALTGQAAGLLPRCSSPEWTTDIPAPSEAAAQVRAALAALAVAPATEIVLHWNDQTAVVTTWQTFVTYWDDFCYPGSDDVAVWPVAGGWVLGYCHEEHFVFRGTAVA